MSLQIIKMTELDLSGKTVLIREDLNVPIKDGEVTSDNRIRAAIPTINLAIEAGCKILIMSHLGRPQEGIYEANYSLAPVAKRLSELLDRPVYLQKNWLDKKLNMTHGEILLLENVRFNLGEKNNDATLAKKMASLCDIFVMDAFGTAHRAQASTHGVAQYAPIACAGPLLVDELEALSKIIDEPERPLLAIVGGSKVSTKLTVLETLSQQVDELIVGGGIANTFIAASGYNVGKSLYEPDLIETAQKLMQEAKDKGAVIPIPVDVITAKEFSENATAETKMLDEILDDDLILDIGPETAKLYADKIKSAATILWNGPVGVFEIPAFAKGTQLVSQAIAESEGFSVAGGGDTLAAIDKFDIADKVSYISTGGGAFLEFVEGKILPAVEILEKRYK